MKVEEIYEAEESITGLGLSSSSSSLVARGQVLLVVRSGILKHTIRVAVNTVEVALNQDMKALRFDPQRCTSSFFLRWVQGLNDHLLLAWAKQGATVESIEHGYMTESIIPLPALSEQVAIDRFLDYETTKIDELVEEQKRLIELLKEKRQAVISKAVTKGLDPNVPMKDSGVEWLGKVPAHWVVTPFKLVVHLRSGGTPDKGRRGYWDGDIPWASAKDLKVDALFDTADHITEMALTEGAATLVDSGVVLVVVRGMILARTFPVVTAQVSMAINQDLKAVSARTPGRNDWLAWLLRASSVETLSRLDEAGHGTKALRMDAWGDMRVGVPPPREQQRIASFLAAECVRLDDLVAEAARAIDFLEERRAALISAAVTGKIDVRGLVSQPEAVAA